MGKDNQLHKRSSRTIAVASRCVNTKKFNTTLQFAEIDYACILGGRKAVSLSKGCHTNQSKNLAFNYIDQLAKLYKYFYYRFI